METNDIHPHHDLVERCKKGDRSAQYELYGLYVDAMFNIGMRMLHNRADAEDIVQEAFIDAFRNLNGFRYESTFGAWLKRIVINKCINFRAKKQIATTSLDAHSYHLHEPEVVTDETFDIQKIKKAIEALKPGFRQVINLYLIEGYDHREISEILQISEGTSKSQYHRAKKRLLKILKQ
ncbi:MAG: RNA polymerase sigma factor [Bacteroidia bacterium]|nr:RNA polymerase sigma factor [Bacteroidia bacterium]